MKNGMDKMTKLINDLLSPARMESASRAISPASFNIGAGIEKDDIPKIFDRFFRVDRFRSSETGGYGLGLSIAKTIMDTLGGEITTVSENGWTAFSLI